MRIALAQSMTKCSSDTFVEWTDPDQDVSAVEIAQPPPPGAVVFTMPQMRRERRVDIMSTTRTDKSAKDLQAVLEKIDAWPEPYARIGRRLHETILAAGPKLKPRIWYGAPGYATARSTPVLMFFRVDDGVMTLGLSEKARVERETGSTLRPCAWYLDDLDEATLTKIAGLVRTAFS